MAEPDADVLEYDEDEMEQEMEELNRRVGGGNTEGRVEFYFSQGGQMECPVVECEKKKKFLSRTKYLRHWNEKHMQLCVSYKCYEKGCKASCRRKYDIKCHLRRIHGFKDKKQLEDSVAKCSKVVKENKRYVNPGIFLYRNRVQQSSSSSSTSSTAITTSSSGTSSCLPATTSVNQSLTSTTTSTSTTQPTPSVSVISKSLAKNTEDMDGPEFVVSIPPKKPVSTITLQEYRSRPHRSPSPTRTTSTISNFQTSFGYSATATCTTSTQTTITHYKPFEIADLPPIPDDETELENYLVYVCNAIDCLGRAQKAAKNRLVAIQEQGKRLDRERQERRKVEAECRRLQQELAALKIRDISFGDLEL